MWQIVLLHTRRADYARCFKSDQSAIIFHCFKRNALQGFLFYLWVCGTALYACQSNQPSTLLYLESSYHETGLILTWDATEWTLPDGVVLEGTEEKSENVLTVRSGWNEDSLYFYFRVEDQCLRAYQHEQDHPRLFLDDMVEVLIDPRMDRDTCWAEDDLVYHINILGVKKDDRGSAECVTDPTWNGDGRIWVETLGTVNDTLDQDTGYLVTLALPWSELGPQPRPGLEMGVNFANGDNDGKGRQLFDWVDAWPMRSPHQFGTLVLKGK